MFSSLILWSFLTKCRSSIEFYFSFLSILCMSSFSIASFRPILLVLTFLLSILWGFFLSFFKTHFHHIEFKTDKWYIHVIITFALNNVNSQRMKRLVDHKVDRTTHVPKIKPLNILMRWFIITLYTSMRRHQTVELWSNHDPVPHPRGQFYPQLTQISNCGLTIALSIHTSHGVEDRGCKQPACSIADPHGGGMGQTVPSNGSVSRLVSLWLLRKTIFVAPCSALTTTPSA